MKVVLKLFFLGFSLLLEAQTTAPNVLIVFADDMGYGDIGAYGATKLKTPNIDQLAKEGLQFRNAYTTSSTCSQSRYALLSGRYWWRNDLHPSTGVVAPGGPNILLKEGQTSIQKVFQENNYATAAFGKWHLGFGLGDNPKDRYNWNQAKLVNGPLETGFDYFFGIAANVTNEPALYIENDDFVGREPGDLLEIKGTAVTPWSEEVLYKEDEVATTVTQKTVDYITNAATDQPLFLYYSSIIPHKPITPAAPFIGTSECGLYGDFIQELDAEVGQVIAALEATGRLENTLIIFTSDNGPITVNNEAHAIKWGNEPDWDAQVNGHMSTGVFRGGKHSIYEGGDRIPFIIRWPGVIPADESTAQLFSLTDVFPSLCSLVGIPYPNADLPDAVDQAALFRSSTALSARSLMPSKSSNGIFSIKKGRWKMILNDPTNQTTKASENVDQLFDLEADPAEANNLFDLYPSVVEELRVYFNSEISTASVKNKENLHFQAYPNPAGAQLQISSELPFTRIEIYNLLGTQLLSQEIQSSRKYLLNTSNLPQGAYFLKLIAKEKEGFVAFLKN